MAPQTPQDPASDPVHPEHDEAVETKFLPLAPHQNPPYDYRKPEASGPAKIQNQVPDLHRTE